MHTLAWSREVNNEFRLANLHDIDRHELNNSLVCITCEVRLGTFTPWQQSSAGN